MKESMKYPDAEHPAAVGSYPLLAFAGGGHFYDAVLEYRVWYRTMLFGRLACRRFARFGDAQAFAHRNGHRVIALVRQDEWIDGENRHKRDPRVTEWDPAWLADQKRGPHSIRDFLSALN